MKKLTKRQQKINELMAGFEAATVLSAIEKLQEVSHTRSCSYDGSKLFRFLYIRCNNKVRGR